jgi:hypothetical protein
MVNDCRRWASDRGGQMTRRLTMRERETMSEGDLPGFLSAALWAIAWAFAFAYVLMLLTPQ